ncbi:uncharacterized protein LOC129222923 [Uloborus diversus]|uniref:uncharacterized protein LOC129222923 n=1 Tax=Uloborus diversus TaxID=327109 RepID=UPI00240A4B8E|nr:uncharacterized protein LOC129222923 [Uloborus diversus]
MDSSGMVLLLARVMAKDMVDPTVDLTVKILTKKGVLSEETENNNHSSPKWTLTAMEKYMRDESESSVALGLLPELHTPHPGLHHIHNAPTYNGDVAESGEESSPSWASSSTGNTPSYGSGGVSFDFNSKRDESYDKIAPVITTTSCTPKSTPENTARRRNPSDPVSLSADLLAALNSDLELSLTKPRKSRKDSGSSIKSEDKVTLETPTKTSKLVKLLRRTRSAGCSKDVPSNPTFMKEKTVSV